MHLQMPPEGCPSPEKIDAAKTRDGYRTPSPTSDPNPYLSVNKNYASPSKRKAPQSSPRRSQSQKSRLDESGPDELLLS